MILYLVGRIFSREEDRDWEVLGIYSNKDKAVMACSTRNDFVARIAIDESSIQITKPFEGYYPLRSKH